MKTIALLLIMLCGTVYGQTAYRFCNPQYGIKDPREYLPESLYTNCVLWMPMNNDPTKLASWGVPDGSWSRNDCSQSNADNRPIWTNACNGALNFDGASDTVVKKSCLNLPTTTGTYGVWLYRTTTNSLDSLAECGDGTANNVSSFYFNGNNIYIYAAGQGSGNNIKRCLANNSLGKWIFFVATFNTAGDTGAIYTNAVSLPVVESFAVGNPQVCTNVYIGANDAGNNPTAGIIGDLFIFNRAISSNEVVNLTNLTKGKYGL